MDDDVFAPGPQTRIDPAVEYRLIRAGTFIRWLVAIYASLALIGVVSDGLAALLPSGPVFLRDYPAVTAWALALLAWASVAAGIPRSRVGSLPVRRVGAAVSGMVALFGFYVIAVFAFGFPELWFADLGTLPIPALWVAMMLVILGVSIPLSISRFEVRVVSAQIAALLVFSANSVIFLGYLYGDISVGQLFRPPEISFQSALISLLVAVGVLLIRPGSGILAAASSPGAGGRLLRRLGPAILLLPPLLLFIVETVPSAQRIDALAVISVSLGLLLLVSLAAVVRVIDATAVEASAAAAQAERARVGLEQEAPVVRSLAEALHIIDIPEGLGLDVATRFRPGTGSVSGDSSAIRALPGGTVAAVLVDMTGHGAEPAIRAIRVRDLLVHSLALGKSPSEALNLVGWTAPGGVLASAVAMVVDPESGATSLASAGHPPSILVTTQQVELLGATGPLLYLDPQARYGEVRFELGRGDSLVMVSDGVADVQRTRNGRQEPEMLADALMSEGGVASRSAELAIGFAEGEPTDDQSVLVVRRDR